MAAPMSEETMSEPEEEEPGEINEINPLSPYFNPLKALYSSKIALPFPEASVFDNLYQYERVTGSREQARQGGVRDRGKDGGAAGSRAASHGGQPHGPSLSVPVAQQNIKSSRPIQRRNEPVQLGTGFRATKDMLIDTQKYKPVVYRNALTRMSEYATGPLSVLFRCMNERCKVRVCTRSFKGLRSICTGYVVTFDKFFNMALVDVDETWRRPSTGQRFYHEEKLTFSKIMESTTYNPKDSVKLTEFDNSKAQRSTETRQLQRETAASTSHPRRSSSLPDRDRLRTLETSGSTEVGAKPSPSHSRDGGQLDQNKSKDLHERRSKHTKEQSHRPSQEYKEKDFNKNSQKHVPKGSLESSRKESEKHSHKAMQERGRPESRESSRKGSQRSSSCKSLQESSRKDSEELRVKATQKKSRKDLQDRSSKHGERKKEKTKKDKRHEKVKKSEKDSQDSLSRTGTTDKEAEGGGSAEDEDDIELLQKRFAALQKELTTLSDDDTETQEEEGEEATETDIETLQKRSAALLKELTTLSDDATEEGQEAAEGATETDIELLQKGSAALQNELTLLPVDETAAQDEDPGGGATVMESLQKRFAALQKELSTLSDDEEEGKGEKGTTETEIKKADLESVTDSQIINSGQPTTQLAEGSNEVIDIKCQAEPSLVGKFEITQHSKAVVHKETDVEHTESEARTKEKMRGGRLKIKPEDFKRRHVNQLFIRGDNVVLVSVDSNLLPR
ncbi:retinitis pigmentosa 1-like 1 protein isoform X1 [Asterias rubens]|uniref:retinitis pigmentosa 1-like 1 protein isoform X1 n=1 Tax=Asterias rubens TaxID=7604 RepID=UPI001455A3EA|nr:retinitis pigmentosa 1-like 1 protein isoform X1 [Asterias rubens]